MKRHKPNYLFPFLLVALFAIIAVFALKTKQDETGKPTIEATFKQAWTEATPFNHPRRALAAVTYNNHLYVIGGIDASNHYVRTVEYTKINLDGQLNAWQTGTDLNEGRFYLAAAAINGFLYAIGGAKGALGEQNTPVATVEKAKINPDGSLGEWQIEQELTTPRRGLTVNQHNSHLYALGGYNGVFLHSIEHTTVNHDGTLNEWQLSPLQSEVDRYIHSSTISRDTLYLLAGHMKNSNTVSYGDVESSQLTATGALTPWRIENSRIVTPRFIASAFSLGDFIYIAAGHDGARRLGSVEVARIDATGRAGDWQEIAPLITPRSGTATATHNNRVYIVGGISQNRVLNSVESAIQTIDGKLGNLATDIK